MKPLLMVDCYQDGAEASPNFLRYLPIESAVVRTKCDTIPADIGAFTGMVISGSSASVNEPPDWISPLSRLVEQAAQRGTPVLGVCFGHQLLAHVVMGDGSVALADRPEVGFLEIEVVRQDPLFEGIPSPFRTFVSHADEVTGQSDSVDILARSAQCGNHAFRVKGLPMWGVQFHSEMDKAEHLEILEGRAIRHPELQLNVGEEIARHVDSAPIAQRMFGNFIHQVQKLRID